MQKQNLDKQDWMKLVAYQNTALKIIILEVETADI